MSIDLPTLDAIRARHAELQAQVLRTPTVPVVSGKFLKQTGIGAGFLSSNFFSIPAPSRRGARFR